MTGPRPMEVTAQSLIRRPPEEVRAQFADIAYHVHANVHPRLRLTLLSADAKQCRFRQEARIAGIKQVDEILNTLLDDGSMLSEIVAGTNRGLTIRFSYTPTSPGATRLTARFEIPRQGLARLLGRLFALAVRRAADRALEQDRRDLESGAYQAYREARAAQGQRG